jgi:hypothetical protein
METEIHKRGAGPFNPDERGPIAGDVIIKKDQIYYAGGGQPRMAKRDIKLNRPLDYGEIGTAWNGYDF